MKIVVVKMPKCLRGIVKTIFKMYYIEKGKYLNTFLFLYYKLYTVS